MSKDLKRYAVVLDAYVYAPNDYMARKKAHLLRKYLDQGAELHTNIDDPFTKVIEINEVPFAFLHCRKLEDISEPVKKENDELPF